MLADERLELFHVTPWHNMTAILTEGVNPHKSRGKRRVSWWVTDDGLTWAGAHVSNRYMVSTRNLVVFQAFIPRSVVRRTAWPIVYTCDQLVRPDESHNFMVYLPKLPE